MKKIFVFGLLAAAMMAFTSCLGDSATSFTMANAAGVVDYTAEDWKIIHVKGGEAVSSKDFQSVNLKNGNCILFDYSIDYGSGDNVDKGKEKGYMTATIYENTIKEVPKFKMFDQLQDTSKVADKEMSINRLQERYAYIEGHLFLYLEIMNHQIMQVDSFSLSYNPQQVDSEKIYDFYLRAIKTNSTDEAGQNMLIPCSFDIKNFVEKNMTDNGVKFRINYVSGFKNDGNSCSWKVTDVFTIERPEENK